MSSILIVYGSHFGQTARIVERLANRLTTAGHRVTVVRGDVPASLPAPGAYAAVVVAGSVEYGKHQPYLGEFVRAHAERLNGMPSAFISVCGAMAGTWEKGRATAHAYIERFLQETGWRPRLFRSLAGGIPYTRYGFLTRLLMQVISRATGRPTDTSRDWDLTDWDEVDRLAGELSRLAPMAEVAVGPAA